MRRYAEIYTTTGPRREKEEGIPYIGNLFLHECAEDALQFHISQLSNPAYEYQQS